MVEGLVVYYLIMGKIYQGVYSAKNWWWGREGTFVARRLSPLKTTPYTHIFLIKPTCSSISLFSMLKLNKLCFPIFVIIKKLFQNYSALIKIFCI